jgi:hypothetical protein
VLLLIVVAVVAFFVAVEAIHLYGVI